MRHSGPWLVWRVCSCLVLAGATVALLGIASVARAQTYDPLVLDLDGDGIDLRAVVDTSLASDEPAILHWTSGGTDDAFVLIDATSLRDAGFDVKDGAGTPLTGDVMFRDGLRITRPGAPEIVTASGWDLIAIFDSDGNATLDDLDTVWQHLRLFDDTDGSGSIDAGETSAVDGSILKSFFETGDVPTEDQFGNLIDSGVFVRQDDSQGPMASVRLRPVVAQPVVAGAVGETALLDGAGAVSASVTPFGGFLGGVRVAVGDLNADGVLDLVSTPADAGSVSEVAVHDGATLAPLGSFLGFPPGYTGTATVAVGDLNRDGVDDIVVGANVGLAHVRVVDGRDISKVQASGEIEPSALLADFYAFSTAYSGGATVSIGDVNGDGIPDIVVGARTGLAHVRVVDGTSTSAVGADGVIQSSALLGDFLGFPSSYTGGVQVACGDVDATDGLGGDGLDDIVLGAAVGLAHVRIVDAAAVPLISGEPAPGDLLRDFFAFPLSYNGGVQVGAGDVDADAHEDVVVGAATGLAHVRVVNGASNPTGEVDSASLLYESTPFGSSASDGVHVAAYSLPEPASGAALLAGASALVGLSAARRRGQTSAARARRVSAT